MRQVNILPDYFQRQMRVAAMKKTLMVSAVMLCLIIVPLHLWLARNVRLLRDTALSIKMSRAMPEMAEMRTAVERLKSEREAFVTKHRALLELSAHHLQYRDAIQLIGDIALNRVWLTALSVNCQQRTLVIQGNSYDAQLVSEFLLELKKASFFIDVDLTSMQTQGGKDDSIISFNLTCKFD